MGILYGHRCVLCGADFPVTTSRTLQLCPDCAAAVRREYRCNEVISIAGADGTIAPLYYRGTVQNAMKRFKFSSAAYCADCLLTNHRLRSVASHGRESGFAVSFASSSA